MNRILALHEKAKTEKRKIVLPEGDDPRVLQGASYLASKGLVDVIVLGARDAVAKLAEENSVSLDGVDVMDPANCAERDRVVEAYYEKRKHKGITPAEAEKMVVENHVNFGAMMTRMGLADGFVAGASNTTSTVARAAIQCLGIDREIGTVSSSFIMELENCPFGEDGLFIYGDCGIIPYPSARQLVGIAIATSDQMKKLFDIEPRVAMLSYSTKGSASGESVDTIREAIEKIRAKRPALLIDGELQLDSAIVPEVAAIKCPGSEVAGRANVLIFPNLDAGNISYKLSQRLGNARAVGPIIQGVDKPCSDLSRGCSWEDVVDTAVVCAIKAQGT
jgi:phosphate acetyltransferase